MSGRLACTVAAGSAVVFTLLMLFQEIEWTQKEMLTGLTFTKVALREKCIEGAHSLVLSVLQVWQHDQGMS